MEATILMSLLQPAPETFQLFDDIILLSEGQVVYNGPKENVLEFFRGCGFKCPERKGIADFLQEVRPPPFLLLLLPLSSISSHIKNQPIKSCA
jgi:ABC-type multidrug transport system ATPase subunit